MSLPHGALIPAGTHAFYALATNDGTGSMRAELFGSFAGKNQPPWEAPRLLCKDTWFWASRGNPRVSGACDEKSPTGRVVQPGLSWLQLTN